MILASHGIIQSSARAFDTDYQAVLTYATSLGYTLPSSGQQIKQNQLMLDLKAGGIWSKLDTFAMFANDGGSNFGLIDWKRLSLYTGVNSPTFTNNQGFQGNGTSSYIDVNYNPSISGTNYSQNNASIGFYSQLMSHDSNYIYSGGSSYFRDLSSTLFRQAINDGDGTNRTSPTGEIKYVHSDRNSSTNKNLYENGVQLGPYTMLSSSEATAFTLLKLATSYSSSKISCFYCGASMTSEVSNFNTILNTYMTSL